MSKLSDYSWLVWVLGCCAVVFYFHKPDLPTFFEKQSEWMKVEKAPGFFSKDLDRYWAAVLATSLEVEAKIRKAEEGAAYHDFIYKAKAKITDPIVKKGAAKVVESYEICFKFDLIDEDDFIIYSITDSGRYSAENNIYPTVLEWKADEISAPAEFVTVSAMREGGVPAAVAKQVKKISCTPTLKATFKDEK